MPMSRRDIATAFLQQAASGNIRDAYAKHVAPNFRHHNPFFRGDAQSLKHGMEENAARFPNKRLEIMRTLEDGDLVATYSHVQMLLGDRGIIVVHIFRFEGDRIAELWDIGQPVPEDSANENGML